MIDVHEPRLTSSSLHLTHVFVASLNRKSYDEGIPRDEIPTSIGVTH
jgi:hypothetical protein